MEISIKGKVAIITGGSRGIGREIATAFTDAGASVYIISRNKEALDVVSKSIGCYYKVADVRDPSQIERVFADIGKVDTLVNGAGVFAMKSLLDSDWKDVVDTNLIGTIICTKEAVKYMSKQRSGKIINISSIDAIKGMSNHATYAATKGAINAFTRSLAVEVGRYNINVNAVAPGFVRTEMTEEFHRNEKILNMMLGMSPLARVTTTKDVASLALFLASDASDCITGQTIYADCGVTSK